MQAISIETIKARQDELAQMIAALERRPVFPISVPFPDLNEGEKHVGVIISADGTKREHVILLPGQKHGVNWTQSMEWAKSVGGELPDRVEASLLFATMVDEFDSELYWTRAQHAADAYYAWGQSFDSGNQNNYGKGAQLRARAVRRLTIQ